MYMYMQAVESHCGGGEAVWMVEGEECEGEKGCIYVMGNFDNSLYKTLQGNFRYCIPLPVFFVYSRPQRDGNMFTFTNVPWWLAIICSELYVSLVYEVEEFDMVHIL